MEDPNPNQGDWKLIFWFCFTFHIFCFSHHKSDDLKHKKSEIEANDVERKEEGLKSEKVWCK